MHRCPCEVLDDDLQLDLDTVADPFVFAVHQLVQLRGPTFELDAVPLTLIDDSVVLLGEDLILEFLYFVAKVLVDLFVVVDAL